jgi:uncharacterized membrane protein
MKNSPAAPPTTVSKLTDAIANSLIKVYKAGKLGLVFIFIGLVAIILAQFNQKGLYNTALFILGVTLILVSFVLFLVLQLKNPLTKTMNIKKGKEVVDNLQELSINLTTMVEKLQALSFKYLSYIDGFITSGLPILQTLPLVSDKIKNYGVKIQDIQVSVVEIVQASEQIIKEVH